MNICLAIQSSEETKVRASKHVSQRKGEMDGENSEVLIENSKNNGKGVSGKINFIVSRWIYITNLICLK